MITLEDFEKVDIRVGTIVGCEVNSKARKPAYKVTIDFGQDIGTKTSSAQITNLYSSEKLIGRQVVCVVNFPPIRIGSVKSEVLILGSPSDEGVVLLQTERKVENGAKIF
ncbi:MAG: tRNA-binding protein [Bacteroidales bacterium]|nr:tRNA-binding protein [Bacteroidales bacterium]